MKKFSTYLLVMFMIVFWIIRIIVTIMSQMGKDFMGMVPMNETFEIVILFSTLICALLVIKRNLLGAVIYLVLHGLYFGGDITDKLILLSNNEILTLGQSAQLFFSMLGMLLPLLVFIDLLLDRNRKTNPKDKKTDWFYDNEQFDRKLDERADKNNYRTM